MPGSRSIFLTIPYHALLLLAFCYETSVLVYLQNCQQSTKRTDKETKKQTLTVTILKRVQYYLLGSILYKLATNSKR